MHGAWSAWSVESIAQSAWRIASKPKNKLAADAKKISDQ